MSDFYYKQCLLKHFIEKLKNEAANGKLCAELDEKGPELRLKFLGQIYGWGLKRLTNLLSNKTIIFAFHQLVFAYKESGY